MSLPRQFSAFALVGVFAAVAHYGTLIGLVEAFRVAPVPAALAGYVAGGVVSYVLSRMHVFSTERSHLDAGWRFVLVAGVGFCLTWASMHLMVDRFALPYLAAQIATTGIVMVWSFVAHKFWTFGGPALP
ncbi:MAG: GtrA family protein [Beijerinckiaceae bacterium]